MINFAIITLMILSLALTHLYNWVSRLMFNDIDVESLIVLWVVMSGLWLLAEWAIFYHIIKWAPGSILG